MSEPSEFEAPDFDLPITDAMIEAGDRELVFYDDEYESPRGRAQVLKRVFTAMLAAASSVQPFPSNEVEASHRD